MKKQIIFPLTIIIIVVAGLWLWRSQAANNRTNTFSSSSTQNEPSRNSKSDKQDPADETNTDLPQTLSLKVPFTPQAPTANWDELHNEACEEASALMAHYYFNQPAIASGQISAAQAETEISKLTDWQKQNLGYYLSITTEETQRMIEEVYGLKTKILKNYTEQDLKQELADGHLIVFPANGQMLGNPNFKSPGPIYHMLVIKGYDRNGFITNDPGTKKGYNYPYTFETLENAGGDYSHADKVVNPSPKLAIAVWK